MRLRIAAAALTSMVLAALPLLGGEAPAGAAPEAGGLSYVATLDGQDVAASTESKPLRLELSRPIVLAVQFTNHSGQAVSVDDIGIRGEILGLTLFNVEAAVDLSVPAHKSASLKLKINLRQLRGQATGLIGGVFEVQTAAGQTIDTDIVTDVRGSLFSVYGLLGLFLVIVTILAGLEVALAISQGNMPANRFRRGLLTSVPGIGMGLILVFSFSALRVWAPTGPKWILAVLILGASCFAVGYFTGQPDEDDDEMWDGKSPRHAMDESIETSVMVEHPVPPPPGN
ncbi:hypothetical protein [Smaragdicoccus niigatensis]|uniref:hypothetical protein n=1 Tax=Smaragdicoccus niigatensis TaxID=359359 RepID=UPI0003634C09|nr:hypothetical protein [Smaragdicoccus niigatensis]